MIIRSAMVPDGLVRFVGLMFAFLGLAVLVSETALATTTVVAVSGYGYTNVTAQRVDGTTEARFDLGTSLTQTLEKASAERSDDDGSRFAPAARLRFATNSDPLIEFAENNRATGFASEYTSPSGAKYYDVTKARGPIEVDGPLGVAHHGGCSEVGCLLQAVEEEGPVGLGGSMRTIRNRPPNSPVAPGPPTGLGTPGTPCAACRRVMDYNGVSG